MSTLYGKRIQICVIVFALIGTIIPAQAQQPTMLLSGAIQTGLNNYQNIHAKQNYIRSSEALLKNTRNEYLPNVVVSLQQDFGTVNGQFGPLSGYGAMGTSSSGPSSGNQSWNAAFGASYIMNTNWEVFSFGRLNSKIIFSEAQVKKDSADLSQEAFVLSAKISGAYLNLIIAGKLVDNAISNLNRTLYLKEVVSARTRSGLNAGVDSSIANAEVSSAKLALINSRNNELEIRNQLAVLLNTDPRTVLNVDTSYLKNIPGQFSSNEDVTLNPQVKYFQARIEQSDKYADYLKKSILPGLNLFGIYQARGSGFDYDYSPDNSGGFKDNYFTGIKPARSNYVAGISLAWNILSIKKIKEQANAQKFISKAYQDEYDLISTQLKDQQILADQRIANSLLSFKEVPIQFKAASDAYTQKSVLYKNGLTNIVDLQQAIYALNKAETDLGVAYIQVWQALLLKAAASGDFDLFLKQIK